MLRERYEFNIQSKTLGNSVSQSYFPAPYKVRNNDVTLYYYTLHLSTKITWNISNYEVSVYTLKLGDRFENYIAVTNELARVPLEAVTHISTRIQFAQSANFFRD